MYVLKLNSNGGIFSCVATICTCFFGAVYVNTVDMKISKLDNIILEHEKEIKELKEGKVESKINKGK